MSHIIKNVSILLSGSDAIIVQTAEEAERLRRFLEEDIPFRDVTILGSFPREHLKENPRAIRTL